jgi:hypothetical protein
MAVVERRAKSLANSVWVVDQRTNDELIGCECHGLGEGFGQLSAR